MIWVAPHWDDILLSVPFRLVSRSMIGDTVFVAYSDENEQMETLSRAFYSKYGVQYVAVGLAEASKRGETIREILLAHREALKFSTPSRDLCSALERKGLVGNQDIAVNWTTSHIDHAFTRFACETITHAAGRKLLYYADQPYHLLWPPKDDFLKVAGSSISPIPLKEIAPMLNSFAPYIGIRTAKRLVAYFELNALPEPLYYDPLIKADYLSGIAGASG